jgi:hypothetical protein
MSQQVVELVQTNDNKINARAELAACADRDRQLPVASECGSGVGMVVFV